MEKNSMLLLLLVVGVFGSPPLQIDLSSPFDELSYGPSPDLFAGVRISEDLSPLHYDLTLSPIVNRPLDDPTQFTAPGVVTITLRVNNPTDNITLHANDITIDTANVQLKISQTNIFVRLISHSNNSAMSTYTTFAESELTTNLAYELTIPFVAKVGDRLSGLYRTSYLQSDGTRRWAATTQFQKLGARMAFPSFDEPNFKSTFTITIGRPVGYHSLTNAALLSTVPNPDMENWEWDIHEPTVRMPTYLIAIIVSDFVTVSAAPDLSDYNVKVWGPPERTTNATAGFAATSSAQILTFFEDYLDSKYQFSKLDSAAIPDFSAGAMENWALNTYRLNYLLFIDNESTQTEKWGIARVFAHEISHHWFGDLVTCDWWNDLWLNEGFASYMELLAENATGFEIGALDRYPVDKIQPAMNFDVGANTEPIHSNNTAIVNSQASTIIYQKAASIIRMFQSFLSEETFIAGIQKYLNKYAYANTVQDQLFAELQAQAELDGSLDPELSVKQILDTWTLQTGFPIISVTWFPDHVLFRHEKFSSNPPPFDDTATQEAGVWYTPIAFTKGSDPDFSEASWKPQFWIPPGTQNVSRVLVEDDEWIIVNPGARSYFRTIYCSHFLAIIRTQLEADPNVFPANTRSQMIDDVFKTAFTKGWENAQIEQALSITTYLNKEDNSAVWITVFNNLRPINRYLIDAPFYADFKTYLLSKITPVLDQIGWAQGSGEPPKQIVLRAQLLDWACSFGSPNCDAVAEVYAEILSGGIAVPADLQPIIFCKVVGISDSLDLPNQFSIQEHLLEGYAQATRAERYPVFLNALACESLERVESWLNLTTSESSPFTSGHSITFLQRLGDNPANRELILEYFTNNLARIISVLGESAISNVVSSIAGYTSGTQVSAQVNAFIDAALDVIESGNVRNSLIASRATLINNAVWVEEWGTRIGTWLDLN